MSSAFVAGLILLLSTLPSFAQEAAVQRLMLEARSLAAEGKVNEAIGEYRRVATAVPESPLAAEALIEAARLYREDGKNAEAAELASQVMQTYPADTSAVAAAVLRAEILAESAADKAALDAIASDLEASLLRFSRQAYANLSARSQALNTVARLRLHIGEPAEAAASLVEVLEDEPRSQHTTTAQLLFAEAMLQRGEIDAAWQPLRDARLSEDPRIAARATALASLLHRVILRPRSAAQPWTTSRPLAVGPEALKRPRAVAASRMGQLVVVDQSTGGLLADAGGQRSLATLREASRVFFLGETPIFPSPESIEVGGSRYRFVEGGPKPKELSRIEAATRDGFGNWLLVDRSLDGLARFDREQKWQGELGLAGDAVDVARNERGQVFALSEKPARVQVLDNDQTPLRTVDLPVDRPIALDVDTLGNLYVLDEQRKSVTVLTPDGARLATLGPILPDGTELRSPEDVAVDGAGRIYIADSRLSSVMVVE